MAAKISATMVKKWLERLSPLIFGSAPIVGALHKVLTDSQNGNAEARLTDVEHSMRLQAELNEKVDAQLRMVQALLQSEQRFLKLLLFVVMATAATAVAALIVAVLK